MIIPIPAKQLMLSNQFLMTPSHVHHSHRFFFFLTDNIRLCKMVELDMIQLTPKEGTSQVVGSFGRLPFWYPRIGVLWWKSLKIALRSSMNFSMFLAMSLRR